MESPDYYRRVLKAYWWDERDKLQTDQQRRIPPPAIQKPHPRNAALIDLVPPDNINIGDVPLRDVIKRRKSHRKFTEQSLPIGCALPISNVVFSTGLAYIVRSWLNDWNSLP